MDVVYHLAKVLTESDVHAVRIIWMAYTVSKLKVIKFLPPSSRLCLIGAGEGGGGATVYYWKNVKAWIKSAAFWLKAL